MLKAVFILVISVTVLYAYSLTAYAQTNPVSWSIKQIPRSTKLGGRLTVEVIANAEAGWHVYSLTQPKGGPIATSISLVKGQPFRIAGVIKGPLPKRSFDPNLGINTELYDGSPVFRVPVRVISGARPGQQKLLLSVRFQACSGEVCLLPKTVKLEATINLNN